MNVDPRIDLGLLAVLVAIDEQCSVTLAADKLNLSQPAVSHALKRLRMLTGDELFVRQAGQLTRTPRCVFLANQARQLVAHGVELLSPEIFDDKSAEVHLRIHANEYAMSTFVPKVHDALKVKLPRSTLEIFSTCADVIQKLRRSEFDFAFTGDVRDPNIGRELVAEEIFRERYVGVMSRTHPLARSLKGGRISLSCWLACPHVQFSTSSPSPSSVDIRLAEKGLKRQVILSSQSHMFNLSILHGTSNFYALPSRLLHVLDESKYLTFEIPLDLQEYPYYVAFHASSQDRPALISAINAIKSVFVAPQQKD